MKTQISLLFIAITMAYASCQDIGDIINQINAEKKSDKPMNLNSSAIQPVKVTQPANRKQSEPKKENKKTKTTTGQTMIRPVEQQDSRIVVYRAKDKLPKDVAGSGVVGDFLITGEDAFGGATIIAAEDAMNPFARSFIIKNVSSGYSAGTVLPLEGRKLIHVSPQRPLIFIGRDIIPGQYQVRAQ